MSFAVSMRIVQRAVTGSARRERHTSIPFMSGSKRSQDAVRGMLLLDSARLLHRGLHAARTRRRPGSCAEHPDIGASSITRIRSGWKVSGAIPIERGLPPPAAPRRKHGNNPLALRASPNPPALILAGAAAVPIGGLFLARSQATGDDVAYMKAMIPHHSIAILTSTRADISDPRVRELADEMIEAQRREIAEMKALIEDLEDA